MKCAYCGKRFSGEGPYCSERCRKQGEAAARLAYKTRIPFWIFTVAAAVLALTGGVLLAAAKQDPGFFLLGLAAAVFGLGLVAFPRGRRSRSAGGQILGGVLFTLGILCMILWH